MNAHSTSNAQAPEKPRLSALLAQVATIVTIKTTSIGMNRLDKEASKSSDRQHNAKDGTGKTYASRLAGHKHRVDEISAKALELKNAAYAMSTDWNGERLISNQMLKELLPILGKVKREHAALVEQFRADAPAMIAEAEQNKGSYKVDVPTMEEVNKAFSLEFDMKQIPDSADYVAKGVSAELEAQMRRHFEAGVEAAYQRATTDALQRVAKPLGKLVERLTEYSKIENERARGLDIKQTRMFESVITNVTDIAQVFGSFNLAGDPVMAKVDAALRDFQGVDIEDVKADSHLRDDLTKKAQAILADLADLI